MENYFDFIYMVKSIPTLLAYVHITLLIAVTAAIGGIFIGCFIAIMRMHRIPVIDQLLSLFISFIRGTPILVQMFMTCFGVPEILTNLGLDSDLLSPLAYMIIVFTIYVAVFSGEVIRGALLSIPSGQIEAAYSLNMSIYKTYEKIIIPQALLVAMPALINTVIGELKATSLAFNVGVMDMVSQAQLMGGFSQRYLELYIDIAVIYGVMVYILGQVNSVTEKKFGKMYRW